MPQLPTVSVVRDGEVVIVNVDDFDPAAMAPADDEARAVLAAHGKHTEAKAPVNPKALNKADLVAFALAAGVKVDESMTKDAILAALDAK